MPVMIASVQVFIAEQNFETKFKSKCYWLVKNVVYLIMKLNYFIFHKIFLIKKEIIPYNKYLFVICFYTVYKKIKSNNK